MEQFSILLTDHCSVGTWAARHRSTWQMVYRACCLWLVASAPNTSNKYVAAWQKLEECCQDKPEICSNPFFISLYLNHLAPSNGTKGAITPPSYGIRWAHTVAGLPSPTEQQFAQTTSEGA